MVRRNGLLAVSLALLLAGAGAASLTAEGDKPGQRVAVVGPREDRSAAPDLDVSYGAGPTTSAADGPPVEPSVAEDTAPSLPPKTAASRPPRPARSTPETTTAPPVTASPPDPEAPASPHPHFYDPAGREAAPPGPSLLCDRSIAFVEDAPPRITASGVYTYAQGRLRKLVSGTNGGTWSADRRFLVFQAPDDNRLSADLCVLDVSARSAKRIAAVMYADGGSYAPGGSELWARDQVVVNDDAMNDHLVAIATDSGAKTNITAHASFDVSPDGTRVAVLEPMDAPNRHLHVHDLLHGTARDLSITRRESPYGVRWIDDKTVAFGNSDIITKDVDTGAETEVVAKSSTPLAAWAYSATERRFAFVLGGAQPAGDDGLYVVRRDGTDRRLVRSERTLVNFAWNPDGRSLLAVHGDARQGQTLRLDPLGDEAPTVIATSDPGYGFNLRDGWSPDGATVEFSVMFHRFA